MLRIKQNQSATCSSTRGKSLAQKILIMPVQMSTTIYPFPMQFLTYKQPNTFRHINFYCNLNWQTKVVGYLSIWILCNYNFKQINPDHLIT